MLHVKRCLFDHTSKYICSIFFVLNWVLIRCPFLFIPKKFLYVSDRSVTAAASGCETEYEYIQYALLRDNGVCFKSSIYLQIPKYYHNSFVYPSEIITKIIFQEPTDS